MISLKRTLDEIEQHERLFRASLEAYLAGIAALARHTPPMLGDEVGPFRTGLAELRKRLSGEPALETIRQSQDKLEQQLRDYKERLQGVYLKQQREVQEILSSLAAAASMLEQQNATYTDNFRSFARQLEAISRLENLAEIRRRLTIQIAQMKTAMEQASREHEASLQQLRRELQAFQSRLEQAEQLAATDSLTGLANRRDCERRIKERIQAGQEFSIILLDLDQFKAFNDRYG
ncbi:MAG: GGDEF domain-containing protein, partial [Bryobacteraceae bacterium]